MPLLDGMQGIRARDPLAARACEAATRSVPYYQDFTEIYKSSNIASTVTLEQAMRVQSELLRGSDCVPNGEPFLTYGIWVLPFSRDGAASEVFLIDRKITSEADNEKAKEEAVDKLNQAIAGLGA